VAALDHRVPSLPSTAAEAGVPAFSVDEAVTALPCESRVSAALAGDWVATRAKVAMTAATNARTSERGNRLDGAWGVAWGVPVTASPVLVAGRESALWLPAMITVLLLTRQEIERDSMARKPSRETWLRPLKEF
jgi:hypothetical protein